MYLLAICIDMFGDIYIYTYLQYIYIYGYMADKKLIYYDIPFSTINWDMINQTNHVLTID